MATIEGRLARLTEANKDAFHTFDTLREDQIRLENRANFQSRQTADLDDRLAVTGLEQLTNQDLRLFVHDVGLGHLEPMLGEMRGVELRSIHAHDLTRKTGMSYDDSCRLLLRAYIAQHHCETAAKPIFAPPADTMLEWTAAKVRAWLASLPKNGQYGAIMGAGWSGPALASATVTRLMDVGGLSDEQAAQLLELIEEEKERQDDWTARWTAEAPIGKRRN